VIEFDAEARRREEEADPEAFEARRRTLATIPRAEPRERPHGAREPVRWAHPWLAEAEEGPAGQDDDEPGGELE
jgi:hypothetical protein